MLKQGAFLQDGGRCVFRVWAPLKQRMLLHITAPGDSLHDMAKDADGYFSLVLDNIPPGARYCYRPEGKAGFPDPASFFQPEGVHAPSQVFCHNYRWRDDGWKGVPEDELILYEIHTGTFSPEGTFRAIEERLDDLAATGINAIELMPVCQFPGARNWGYDGVYPYAVHNAYGGPEQLKRLVDACHQKGIAVFLDVVYNHLGPEGNYLSEYGPYYTARYSTPWGRAVNFDGPWSDGVRDFFVDNIRYWITYFHIDGLRLDAVHQIYDSSAVPVWNYIREAVDYMQGQLQRHICLIAESDLNSPRVVQPVSENGYGFDAQWLDDFHHAFYVLLYPEGRNRYYDFGTVDQAIKSLREGFVHSGEYVLARQRTHGASSRGLPGNRFVAFFQNHDQVGNNIHGARLHHLAGFKRAKIAAALLLLSPYIPLLFMGEEYGETAPFFYFIHHSDPELTEAVKKGREQEFRDFFKGMPPPDPADPETFRKAKLTWRTELSSEQKDILEWYRLLIGLRKAHPALRCFDKTYMRVENLSDRGLSILRSCPGAAGSLFVAVNLSEQPLAFSIPGDTPEWTLLTLSENSGGLSGHCLLDPLSVAIFASDKNNYLSTEKKYSMDNLEQNPGEDRRHEDAGKKPGRTGEPVKTGENKARRRAQFEHDSKSRESDLPLQFERDQAEGGRTDPEEEEDENSP